MSIKYRPEIDGLRAIAVAAVILNHLAIPGFSGGFVGVDIFFVISGYLIASIIGRDIADGRFSLIGFYERRIRRILPALFALLLVITPIAFWLLLPGELRAFGETLAGTTLFSSNFILLHQSGYFAAQSSTKPLLHTWSLGIEEQFYVLFPLLLLVLARRPRVIAWLLAALAALSLASCIWATKWSPDAAFFEPQYRAWELLTGALLARMPRPALPRAWSDGLTALGLGLSLFAIWSFSPDTPFPGIHAALPVLGALLIILAGEQSHRIAGALLRARAVVFAGRISYSAYLWHWPLIAFGSYYLLRPFSGPEAALILCLSFAAAAASWRWIEEPVRHGAIPRRRIFLAALAGTLLFAGTGFLFYRAAGFPERFPPNEMPSYRKIYRVGTCQIEPALVTDWRQDACTFPAHADPRLPRIFVLGDSFAAQYVPGLEQLQTQVPSATVQATASACAPLLQETKAANPACENFNQVMTRKIIAARPALVIVAGVWRTARDLPTLEAGLGETLRRLRQAGIKVLLIGDTPIYYSDVPQIQRMLRQRGDNTQWYVPYSNLWADPAIRKLAARYGAGFFSPREFFCSGAKCRFSDGELFTFDIGHLTPHGSALVARAMAPKIKAMLAQ